MINIIHPMFENNSSSSVKDSKSDRFLPVSECCSLPYIYDKVSTHEVRAPTSHHPKQKLKLPTIRQESQHRNVTQPDQPYQSLHVENQLNPKLKKTFARQMEERMRCVLGGLQANNQEELYELYDSDDFDFEARVNANRQIIKKQRARNEKKNPSSVLDKRPPVAPTALKAVKKRQSSSKQGVNISRDRDISIQNKNRKKSSIKGALGTPPKQIRPFGSNRKSLKDLRPRQEKFQKTQTKEKPSVRKDRVNSQQSVQKVDFKLAKNANLFDNIQNYLSNPVTNKSSLVEKQAVGLSLLKAKRDLQDKIKDLNRKLGAVQNKESNSPSTTHQSQDSDGKPGGTANQWRRVIIMSKEINYSETDFNKQVERLAEMQQKNGVCLDKYLENQKILVDLQISRKMRLKAKSPAAFKIQ